MKTVLAVATAVIVAAFAVALDAQRGIGATGSLGPLHERARSAGGRLVETLADEHPPAGTIAELAARSPVVVIGKVLGVRAHLASDGARITTDVAFKVQEVVKGGVKGGEIITVMMPGGNHLFADGTTARQYRWGYHGIRNGSSYVLFLQESPARTVIRGAVAYEFAVGSQGQFELDFAKRTVTPAAAERTHPLAGRYRGSTVRQILVELHAAVPRTR
jgi:hypothetical protein